MLFKLYLTSLHFLSVHLSKIKTLANKWLKMKHNFVSYSTMNSQSQWQWHIMSINNTVYISDTNQEQRDYALQSGSPRTRPGGSCTGHHQSPATNRWSEARCLILVTTVSHSGDKCFYFLSFVDIISFNFSHELYVF